MKKTWPLLVAVLCVAALGAQGISPWQNLRHSSRDADGKVHIRWENIDPLVPAPQFWSRSGGSGWQMQDVNPLQAPGSFEALPSYNWGQKLRYRLRSELDYQGVQVAFMHGAWLDGDSFPPDPNAMALIGSDPSGDTIQIHEPMLDLGDSWIGLTQQKIHSSLANQSGSFPTLNSLSSYNAWLTAIANPEAVADSVIYAMVYTFNIPGVVSPGLYKVGLEEGLTPTFARIGNIQTQVSGGKLFMSCNLADLTADPSFGAWPNAANALAISSFSMRINVDMSTMTPEVLIGDYSFPGMILFEDHHYQVQQNSLPVITGLIVGGTQVFCTYQDAEEDFPLVCEFETSDGFVLQLEPESQDYSSSVVFSGILPQLCHAGTLRFSDNGLDYVEIPWEEVSVDDPALAPPALSCFFTNPTASGKPLQISLKGLDSHPIRISVYNLRGQRLHSSVHQAQNAPQAELLLPDTGFTPGVYLLKVSQAERSITRKFSIIK